MYVCISLSLSLSLSLSPFSLSLSLYISANHQFLAARKTGAVLFPVLQQHSLQGHVMTSAVVTDDNACALNCLSHHACYSFNFMASRKLCELSDSTRNQFPLHLVRNRSVVYYEMDFT